MFVKKEKKPSTPSRRIPAQERSRKRLERILAAAAEEFDEQGYESATMERIAERAETSIGSVYQFFRNKEAVFLALARKIGGTLRAVFDVVVTEEALTAPWQTVIDAGIDAFAALNESDPAFRAVWRSAFLTRQVIEESDALGRELAARVAVWLGSAAPHLDKDKRAVVSTMVIEGVSGILLAATWRGGDEGRALMQEAKVMMRRYLTPYMSPPAPGGATHTKRGAILKK
jgi:AcrR family transcriptional regulator